MCSERVVLSFKEELNVKIIRPATVCGYSPRMRFDVSVNALTSSAFLNKKIIVQGGDQIRPNIHIDDLTDLYLYFLEKKTKGIIFNAGFENLSIRKIAKTVQKHVKSDIIFQKNVTDPRSYRLDSSKLLKTGFKPKKKVEDAIQELHEMFLNKKIKNNPSFYSIKWLKNNELFKK
jgi:nucleoside-diphosphate-sugar epimerase